MRFLFPLAQDETLLVFIQGQAWSTAGMVLGSGATEGKMASGHIR